MKKSPFAGRHKDKWITIRDKVIAEHPLDEALIVTAVEAAWHAIINANIGGLKIIDIKPQPQIMGFLLHELIPIEIARLKQGWRRGTGKGERDVHCLADSERSIEIKTSSHKSNLFGNRSYGKRSEKSKAVVGSYYIGVNFEKFEGTNTPRIRKIRFGWLDPEDWRSQEAESGQASTFSKDVRDRKLKEIYSLPAAASKGCSKGKTR